MWTVKFLGAFLYSSTRPVSDRRIQVMGAEPAPPAPLLSDGLRSCSLRTITNFTIGDGFRNFMELYSVTGMMERNNYDGL